MVHHILVSSAETIRAFNTGFDTVNLQCPTVPCSGYTLPMTTSRGYLASPRPDRLWNVVTATSSTL